MPDIDKLLMRVSSKDRQLVATEWLKFLRRVTLVLAYLCCYHWSYVSYVNPTWEYGHYYYFSRELELHVLFYVFALFPLIFLRSVISPANFGVSLIYLLSYAPGQLTILFMWTGSERELIAVGLLLMVSMCVLIFAAEAAQPESESFAMLKRAAISEVDISPVIKMFLYVLTIVAVVVLIIENRGHMKLVSFYDVYSLRSEAAAASGGVSGYLTMWLSLVLVPYYAARAITHRRWCLFAASLAIALLLYMSNGSKISLLMPFVVLGLRPFLSGDFISRLTLALLSALIILMIIDNQIFDLVKAIFVARTLSVSGWTIAIYHEYFTTHMFTNFGHVGIVQALFDNYPYGAYSPGQMIGSNYSGSAEANFNAGFWASDGIAAVGVAGIWIVTIPVALYLIILNWVSKGKSTVFVCLWSVGFWVTLMNAPLSVALLSGGGILLVVALLSSNAEWALHYLVSVKRKAVMSAAIIKNVYRP